MNFKCIKCGECCKLRSFVSDEERGFLEEFGYGKLPMVQMQAVDKISFPLWGWEAERFKEWGQDKGIDPKIKESRVIFDLISNKVIIVAYYMDSYYCPFLQDNECMIHNKQRAYICRSFPFNKGPFLKVEDGVKKEILFGNCSSLEKIFNQIPSDFNEMIKFFNNSIRDEFLNIVQNDIIAEHINKIIIQLMKTKKIRPAMNYPYDFLLKRINNSEKVDLTEFLVETKLYTQDEMDYLIERFDKNEDAREKIKECL